MPTEAELNEGFSLGEWQVLPRQGLLQRGEQVERPEPKVFEVLMVLAQHGTDLVTKQALIDDVWGGRPTSDEPIARCLSQLRGHLDDRKTPHQLIETLHRRGYRLMQPVVLKTAASAEPATPAGKAGLAWWKMAAAIIATGLIAVVAVTALGPKPAPVHSIAVMPFSNISGDAADAYLVSGFKDELVQQLHGIEDLSVKTVRVSYPSEPGELAKRFNVESVLFGTLQRVDDVLKISYTVSDRFNVVIHSGDVEGDIGEQFDLQEKLAALVRRDLVGKVPKSLLKSRPSDSVAYDSYMRGMFALEQRGNGNKLEDAIRLFQDAVRLDREYGPSYLALATAYALMPIYGQAAPAEMNRLALETVDAGVVADPLIADAAGAIYGYVYHMQKRWLESEQAYLRAVNADVVDSNAFNWYSRMLASVGRLDEALQQILAALEIDPSSPVVNSRTALSYAWLGEDAKALEYYERANDLGWSSATHILAYAFTLMQSGRADEAKQLAIDAVQMSGASTDWIEPVFAALDDPRQSDVALEALLAASADQSLNPIIELTVRSILGDQKGALRVARLLEEPGEAFEMDLLFMPQLVGLRRHPDFLPLLKRLGVADYWKLRNCDWDGDRAVCSPP